MESCSAARCVVSSLLAIAALGCGRLPLEQRCAFGPERVLARGSGSLIRSVALESRSEGLLAAWTDRSGTFVIPLRPGGEPVSPPRRIAAGAASLDLARTRRGYALALLRRGDLFEGGGEVVLASLTPRGSVEREVVLDDDVGAYSDGIAVAVADDRPAVTWGDARPSDYAVMLAAAGAPPVRVSARRTNGCCPHLVAARPRGYVVAWGEFSVESEGSRVLVASLDSRGAVAGRPTRIAQTSSAAPWPVLCASPGGLGVGYRELRGEQRLENMTFVRLRSPGARLGQPVSMGRYDGRTRAALLCGRDVFVSVAVRSWSREWVIGLDRFDGEGERIGAQLHVFTDHIRFSDVDAVRLGREYVLLYAEDHPGQLLWLARIRCR